MEIALIGKPESYRLEAFYKAAFENLGHQVKIFDPNAYFLSQVPYGRLGRLIARIRPRRLWKHYSERQLLLDLLAFQPKLILAFCSTLLPIGSIALLKARLSTKIGLIWPDTLFNLELGNLLGTSLYDGVACYGLHGVKIFQELGYRNVAWIPLGADERFHGAETVPQISDLKTDVCFVGGWRPERERAMQEILNNLPETSLEIHGPNWKENCGPQIKQFCSGKTLIGSDYSQACRRSRININVIDETNYPAANMRFFELPMAGVLQLSSDCPEMRDYFCHRQHLLYFRNNSELVEQIRWVLEHPDESQQIRINAHELSHREHTYTHRAAKIIELFGN